MEKTNQRFDKLENKVEKVGQRLDSLEEKVEKVEQRLDSLEEGAKKVNQRLGSLEEEAKKVNQRLDSLEERTKHAEDELHRFGVILENDVVHPLRLLCENLYPTSKGWIENEHRLSSLEEDVTVIKTVVRQHSESIHVLQQA